MEQVVIILLALSVLCLVGVVYLDQIKKGRSEGFDVAIPASLMSSFSGGDVSYFPKIVTTQAEEPGSEEIIQKFNQCIAEGRDTVKGCLSSSGAGFGLRSPYCCLHSFVHTPALNPAPDELKHPFTVSLPSAIH